MTTKPESSEAFAERIKEVCISWSIRFFNHDEATKLIKARDADITHAAEEAMRKKVAQLTLAQFNACEMDTGRIPLAHLLKMIRAIPLSDTPAAAPDAEKK